MTTTTTKVLGTGEVATSLEDDSPCILKVDEDTEASNRGHIPGALAVHWRHDLQNPIRRQFIGSEAFAAPMDRLGVGNDTQVALYGGNNKARPLAVATLLRLRARPREAT
jgi:thiosulfate/3-mercaptopyruvate sulfurtransferase